MTEINQNFGGEDDPYVKGDYKEVTIPVTEGNPPAPKTLSGLTNKRWQAWKNGGMVIQKESADISIVNVNGTSDGLRFALTPGDSINLAADLYEHECEIVDAGGKVTTVTKGKFELTDHLIV